MCENKISKLTTTEKVTRLRWRVLIGGCFGMAILLLIFIAIAVWGIYGSKAYHTTNFISPEQSTGAAFKVRKDYEP